MDACRGEKMELAWHMVKTDTHGDLVQGFNQFGSTCAALMDGRAGVKPQLPRPRRLYVGDEFCPGRLPGVDDLPGFLRMADEMGLGLTLLTPVLTDQGIEECNPLFQDLKKWNPGAEVVVNDLGVLFYLQREYPDFQLSMGRLFNKGFKDPRPDVNKALKPSGAGSFLSHCSFNQQNMLDLARSLNIKRFEQDLLPHADPGDMGTGLKRSVYFPFGYVTTGRACFMAGVVHGPGVRFKYNNGCPLPCTRQELELNHPHCARPLFQKGNTIFYRYTPSMVADLFKIAGARGLRLVYQGGMR